MALIKEKAETEMDEITLEPSQAEKTLEGQKPDKCLWELIREQNQAENHAKMVELGLIQEEKPKQVGVKRKKQPAPAPSRRSSRVKELPKVNYDVDDDWEGEHFGKRRKLAEKKALIDKVEVVESRKSPRNLPVINYGQLDADMDDQILGPKTSIPAVKTGTKQAAPEKKLSCPYVDCESSFAYPSHLERHRQSVHLKQRPFKCVTCGLRFTQEFNFTQHVDVVHHKRRPFSCTAEGCGYTCGRASHLKQHTLSQHSAAPPRFPCTHPGCSEHLKSKLGLRIHVMNHLLPFTCQVQGCQNRYETKVERDRHMVNLHPQD